MHKELLNRLFNGARVRMRSGPPNRQAGVAMLIGEVVAATSIDTVDAVKGDKSVKVVRGGYTAGHRVYLCC